MGLPVQHATRHVFPVPRVALHHLIGGLKASVCNLGHRQLFVVRLLCRDNWGIRSQWEVDTGVRHKVGLELCQVNVQRAVESQGRCDGRHDLPNQTVQIRVSGSLDVQVPPANVVDGLIINHKGAIRVLKSRVCCEY